MTDEDLAAELALRAGEILLALRRDAPASGKILGDLGDAAAHELLMRDLARARPDDAVLSEEGKDDAVRLTHDRVWIIDPLDGTREYAEGRDDWAVHVALCIGGVARIGAVAQPSFGKTYVSDRAALAPAPEGFKIMVSRTRPPEAAQAVAEALGGELIGMGSAGAKAMAVLRGEAHAYIHAGGQYEWDSAAPVAVALAAGLHASRLDGSPLVYNRPDPYLPDLVICRPEWAERILAVLNPPSPWMGEG